MNINVGSLSLLMLLESFDGKYDVWLPVVNTVSITLIVQHTPDQLVQFNWDKFASGDLVKGGFT